MPPYIESVAPFFNIQMLRNPKTTTVKSKQQNSSTS